MKQLVLNSDFLVGRFMAMALQQPNAFQTGRGIGVADVCQETRIGKLIAGIWYESFNGANLMMHVAAAPDVQWLNKEILWYAFYYPFVECGCKRVTGLVPESNLEARKFDEHLGFQVEAVLKDAAPDGDLLVYVMFREQCRWLGLRNKVSHLRNQVN